ncbi:NADPH:quinone reductase [Reticulibacter mediterranei]|uniref:NADPH:quinone reductase n=1 Tax=Reticulibacter mediterranei TaxID=2778369 RepID=A0A8J3IYD1_9CHLR|nr:zinc-binding dehydrogenase [Reticulibacter mediterranei]GHO99030.1 NADPH:quinone reductase [Reticulibacter mediterranei]
MRVVRVRQFGTPEVLSVEESEEPQAGPGQVVIAVEVAGVSFGDTSIRAGRYPFPLPFIPGWEVGGRITQVGPDGDQSLVGERVVALVKTGGGYAERVVVDIATICPVPQTLPIEQAVGVFVAGGTALYMSKMAHIRPGEAVLVTAAAGSTGSQLVQFAKAAGAGIVIGAAGSKEKLALVARLGADAGINYREENWTEQVRDATGGKGADVVFDAVGGTIGQQAFEVTARGRGRLVVYGSSSGTETTIGMHTLSQRGVTLIGALGIAMTRTEQETLADSRNALQEAVAGRLIAVLGPTYPLERAAEAHAAIEARENVGKILLIP